MLKFLRLPQEEQFFFIRALNKMAYYRFRLKTTSLQNLLDHISRKAVIKRRQPPTRLTPQRISRLITVAGRFVPFTTCLSRALAGRVLFAQYGFDTTLHIGVANCQESGFEAHAWLTMDDRIILGQLPDLNKYKELPPLKPRHTRN